VIALQRLQLLILLLVLSFLRFRQLVQIQQGFFGIFYKDLCILQSSGGLLPRVDFAFEGHLHRI
jgi:hypothetical protein